MVHRSHLKWLTVSPLLILPSLQKLSHILPGERVPHASTFPLDFCYLHHPPRKPILASDDFACQASIPRPTALESPSIRPYCKEIECIPSLPTALHVVRKPVTYVCSFLPILLGKEYIIGACGQTFLWLSSSLLHHSPLISKKYVPFARLLLSLLQLCNAKKKEKKEENLTRVVKSEIKKIILWISVHSTCTCKNNLLLSATKPLMWIYS